MTVYNSEHMSWERRREWLRERETEKDGKIHTMPKLSNCHGKIPLKRKQIQKQHNISNNDIKFNQIYYQAEKLNALDIAYSFGSMYMEFVVYTSQTILWHMNQTFCIRQKSIVKFLHWITYLPAFDIMCVCLWFLTQLGVSNNHRANN